MPSYGEFIAPPPLDNRPVAEMPASVVDASTGPVCAGCGNPNCPLPGGCS